MNGTQKLILAIVAIVALTGVGIVFILARSDDPSEATPLPPSPIAAESPAPAPSSPSPEPPPETAAEGGSTRLKSPTNVSTEVLSGTTLRVRWKASPQGVRQFVVTVDGQSKAKVSPKKRFATVTTTYGSHCVRVASLALASSGGGYRDSPASPCSKVSIKKPEPEPAAEAASSPGCPPGYVRNGVPPHECVLNDY